MSVQVAGFVTTGYSIGALTTRIFLSPYISARNYGWLIVVGAVTFGAASLASLAADLNVAVLLAARFIQGLGQGVSSVAIQAGVAYMVPPSRLSQGISIVGSATIMSLSVFPPLALAIVSFSGGSESVYAFLLIVNVAFMGTVALFGWYIQRGVSKERAVGPADAASASAAADAGAASPSVALDAAEPALQTRGRGGLFKGFERGALLPSLANATVAYCQGFAMAFVALFCATKGFDNASSFFAAFAVAVLVIRLAGGRITQRYPLRALMVVGFLAGCAGMASLPFVPDQAIWASALLFGVCAGLVNPSMQVLAVSSCSRAGAGAATGRFLACVDVAMMASTTLGGLMIETWGYTLAFFSCAAMLLVGLAVYLLCARERA